MGYQCFSQRLLNPFRGTTSTLRYQSAAGLGIRQGREGAVADYVARYVSSLSADKSSAQLFERRPGGRGTAQAMVRISPGLENRVLPDDAFPGLMPGRWNHDSAHSRLIDDFLRWQAPWLLLLSNLDPEQRRTRRDMPARNHARETCGEDIPVDLLHRVAPRDGRLTCS
jgi:hypothetical protein